MRGLVAGAVPVLAFVLVLVALLMSLSLSPAPVMSKELEGKRVLMVVAPEEYREDYVEFIRNSRRVMTDLISAVTPYKAGVSPILEEEEITQLADILNSNLKQLSIESLPQEIAENPVVKLYSQRIFDRLKDL